MVGALSQHECRSDFKLTYNADRGLYTLDQTLKQGYHNYYVVREQGDRDSAGQLLDVEGPRPNQQPLHLGGALRRLGRLRPRRGPFTMGIESMKNEHLDYRRLQRHRRGLCPDLGWRRPPRPRLCEVSRHPG